MTTGDDRTLAPHIQEILRSAELELQQLNRERAEVVKRICTIKRTLVGLAELFGEKIFDEELRGQLLHGQLGLTAVCRELLLKEGRGLTAHPGCLTLLVRVG